MKNTPSWWAIGKFYQQLSTLSLKAESESLITFRCQVEWLTIFQMLCFFYYFHAPFSRETVEEWMTFANVLPCAMLQFWVHLSCKVRCKDCDCPSLNPPRAISGSSPSKYYN